MSNALEFYKSLVPPLSNKSGAHFNPPGPTRRESRPAWMRGLRKQGAKENLWLENVFISIQWIISCQPGFPYSDLLLSSIACWRAKTLIVQREERHHMSEMLATLIRVNGIETLMTMAE